MFSVRIFSVVEVMVKIGGKQYVVSVSVALADVVEVI